MPRIAVVFTGGTISMRHDPAAGGNVPVLAGADILALVPGLDAIAEVVPIDLGLTPASHFTFRALFGICDALQTALEDPAVDGAVIVQGTDTIEETAFFFDLLHHGPKAVAVTGAMRTSGAADYDGPANLRDAVVAAASRRLRDAGVVVVLAGSIEPADDVTKTHASDFGTFRSLNAGSLGRVDGDEVVLGRERGPRRLVQTGSASERVHLVTATVAMDGTVIDALLGAGSDGIVVAATGAGNTSAGLLAAAERAMGAGVPVAITTRCAAGKASGAYAFPGGGATWLRAGAMSSGHLGGPKARVALALGIGAGLDREALSRLLADPMPVTETTAAR